MSLKSTIGVSRVLAGPYLLLITMLLSCASRPTLVAPERLPTLDLAHQSIIPEQPLLRAIQIWDGHVVAQPSYPRSHGFYVIDKDIPTARPLRISKCRNILSLGENTESLFALCRNDQRLIL